MLCVTLMLATVDVLAVKQLDRGAPTLAALNLPQTSSGVALQRRMATLPHSLMVYGSSELSMRQPTRADLFFQTHPSAGFRALLIGQPGDRCLTILEELAALGERAHGKKFVVFLSPTWFVGPAGTSPNKRSHRKFARNFSPAQTSLLFLNKRLKPSLKADIAARLLDNADVIEKASPLLAYEIKSWREYAPLAWLLQPLFSVQTAVFACQDRWQYAWPLHPQLSPGNAGTVSLRDRIGRNEMSGDSRDKSKSRDFSTTSHLDMMEAPHPTSPSAPALLRLLPQSDDEFRSRTSVSLEWTDLELLLRTSRQLGAHIMLISQPFNGSAMDLCHISAPTRHLYYERVRTVAKAHRVALSDFSGAEDDRGFFSDFLHPSAKAWIGYDQVLDRFYHHVKRSRSRALATDQP